MISSLSTTTRSQTRILQYIDTIHSSIQLSPTLESNNVNFLDLSINRKLTCLGISIFRKPTTTNTTTNFPSNHPLEHKMAAYWFLIRRMLSLPLDSEQQYEEWQHILHIAHSNTNPPALLIRFRLRTQRSISQTNSPTPTTSNNGTKWVTFTYSSPQVRKITNIFKHTNIRIAFKCSNTISQLSKPTNKTLAPTPYDRYGIYALTCRTCNRAYVSQTSQSLKLRYKQHAHYIKSNNPQSATTNTTTNTNTVP